jgi:hypothetical protein
MKTENETFTPKIGERVMVWDNNEEIALERIYLAEIKGVKCPYICVTEGTEIEFLSGEEITCIFWKNIKPLPQKEIPKDTLVWVKKNNEFDMWQQKFYSHCDNGKHYCFVNQKKSNETNNVNLWKIVTDKDPFKKN